MEGREVEEEGRAEERERGGKGRRGEEAMEGERRGGEGEEWTGRDGEAAREPDFRERS